MKLFYADKSEGQTCYGWGCCNFNLTRALRALCDVSISGAADCDVAFIPLLNHDFTPASDVRGKVNFAYTFFESALGPNAAANAAQFDVVFVGSTWCKERCAERGIHNTEVLIQGVDREIFKPGARKQDAQFRIFSGGKFEYRKGQDLVIAAFREFAKTHPEAHLVCSWWNPWPQLITQDLWRMNIKPPVRANTQEDFFACLLVLNGIEPHQFTILPRLTHAEIAREMANTDVGLFPNRCEGGTNLVLMEYAARGGRVVANWGTGHKDVCGLLDDLIPSTEDHKHWAVSSVEEICDALERAATTPRRDALRKIPTWENAAKQIVTRAEELLASHSHK